MMWITSVAVQNLWLAAQLESDIMPTFPFLVTEAGNPCDIKGRQKEVSSGAVISEIFIFASFPQIICICLVMGPDLSASQALSVHWLTKCVWYLPSQSALQTYIVYHSLGTYLKPEVSSMAM